MIDNNALSYFADLRKNIRRLPPPGPAMEPAWYFSQSVSIAHKLGLHLNGSTGAEDEVRKLLEHHPESLSSDDPARLVRTLTKIAGKSKRP